MGFPPPAAASQQEIVNQGRGSNMSKNQFYKKNNRWTEGLISAAKAVASSTNMLIETADGVISGRNSPEQLIVASNDVGASTAADARPISTLAIAPMPSTSTRTSLYARGTAWR